MTPLEDRLRAAAADAFPATPDLVVDWGAQRIRPSRGRRVLVLALSALLLPAAALAIPAVRHALGISAHLSVNQVTVLAPAQPPPPEVHTYHRDGARITEIQGDYILKNVTPDTNVRKTRVGGDPGVWLTGGHHQLAIEFPDNGAIPLGEDQGNALVFERGGTVFRVEAKTLAQAQRVARTLKPSPAP